MKIQKNIKNEEIPPEVANPEIVKALKERRLVVFQ